jgi:hypothetical protein
VPELEAEVALPILWAKATVATSAHAVYCAASAGASVDAPWGASTAASAAAPSARTASAVAAAGLGLEDRLKQLRVQLSLLLLRQLLLLRCAGAVGVCHARAEPPIVVEGRHAERKVRSVHVGRFRHAALLLHCPTGVSEHGLCLHMTAALH